MGSTFSFVVEEVVSLGKFGLVPFAEKLALAAKRKPRITQVLVPEKEGCRNLPFVKGFGASEFMGKIIPSRMDNPDAYQVQREGDSVKPFKEFFPFILSSGKSP
jgi:hypothetical protein